MANYSDTRKIDPSQGSKLGDGTPNDGDRIEIGPTALAFAEWRDAGLELPNLEKMREYRLARIVSHIQKRDYAGVLLFDPLNIRYATDSTICNCGICMISFVQCWFYLMATWCCGIIKTLHFYLALIH